MLSGIEIAPFDSSSQDAGAVADLMCEIAGEAFKPMHKQLGITQKAIERRFYDGIYPPAYEGFKQSLLGKVSNRLGERKSRVYLATDEDEGGMVVGWLTTAVDYTSRARSVAKSYLWLVNEVVAPDYQRQGIGRELLYRAVTDSGKPSVRSLETYVSAYPFTSMGTDLSLPAELILDKAGILPTDEPFVDASFFGFPVFMQRRQGPSPDEVANNLG